MLPNEPSPSTQEPASTSESNPDLAKGSDKLTKIIILFLIIMLIPIFSDPSINISILPFLATFKHKLNINNITQETKDKLTFLFYLSLIILIIVLQIKSILDYTSSESALSVSILGILKEKLNLSRAATPVTSTISSTPESLQDPALDGKYPNLDPVQEVGVRASTVTNIEYSGSVLDISRDSENANSEYNFCSTRPSVDSSSMLDPNVSTTLSMIDSIANEEVSSVSFDNSSLADSDSVLTTPSLGEVIQDSGRRNTFGESIEDSSTIVSQVESENNMAFDTALLSYREAQRARTLHILTTPRDNQ
jgi:hypothetical protein